MSFCCKVEHHNLRVDYWYVRHWWQTSNQWWWWSAGVRGWSHRSLLTPSVDTSGRNSVKSGGTTTSMCKHNPEQFQSWNWTQGKESLVWSGGMISVGGVATLHKIHHHKESAIGGASRGAWNCCCWGHAVVCPQKRQGNVHATIIWEVWLLILYVCINRCQLQAHWMRPPTSLYGSSLPGLPRPAHCIITLINHIRL